MTFPRFLRNAAVPGLLSLAAMLLFPATAAATTRCVSNAYELAAALADVRMATDTLFFIRVRSGIYQITNLTGPFELVQSHSNQIVDVSGGWSGASGGCTTQGYDPGLTTLIGSATKPALTVYGGVPASMDPADIPYNAKVNVTGLTLKNPGFTKAYAVHSNLEDFPLDYWEPESACLNALVGLETNELLLERLDIRDCHAPGNGNATGVIRNIGATLTMRNVAARQSSSLGNAGLMVHSKQGGVSYLSQISITGMDTNPSCLAYPPNGTYANFYLDRASGIDLRATEDGVTRIANSVVWGNSLCSDTAPLDAWVVLGIRDEGNPGYVGDDTWVDGSGGEVWLDHLRVGDWQAWTPIQPVHVTAPSFGDPGFVAPGNPTPGPGSPLIDSGNANPPGGTGSRDASGRPRVLGSRVDVGAYEAQPNQSPTLVLAPQYTVAAGAPTGTLVFTAAANDDGLPGPLGYSLSSLCPGQIMIDTATGAVRLAAANPSAGGACDVTVTVSDGALQTAATTHVVLLATPSDVIFTHGFDAAP